VVAVGDSAEVELIFSSGRRRAGKLYKKATVTCNDHSRGNFQIGLKGNIYNNPDSLYPLTLSEAGFQFYPENRDRELKIEIKNVSQEKLKLRLVTTPGNMVKIDFPGKEIKPGKSKEIKVKIDKSFDGNAFKKSLTFELNDSASTRYSVPILFAKAKPIKRAAKPVKPATASIKKSKSGN